MKVARLVCVCGWRSHIYPEQTMFAGPAGQLPCPECTKFKRNHDLEVYGIVKRVMDKWNEEGAGLLLYFETCLVDQYGRVEGRRINKEEIDLARKWVKEGFIKFGRLRMEWIQKHRGNSLLPDYHTYYVRFSDAAWKITHQIRRERSDRMVAKNKEMLEDEMA